METSELTRRGADLIFLSEFPIGVLSDRPPETKSVSFELQEKGKRRAKRWIIDAAARFGLPNYVDMQLFIICLAYTQEQAFSEQVRFCRHRLVQDLGWPVNQQSYDRIQLGLDRLVGTTYTAINHYPDPKGRDCVKRMVFHLMEAYQIHDSRHPDAQLPPSWFRWSQEVQDLLSTRQLKTLDLEVFRTLKRPVSQAMYRYLHTRHLDGKGSFEENLIEYACERLGLSRDFRWASDLKRTLDHGHRELIERGLIARATYERMRGEKGERAQQKVVIHYPVPATARERGAASLPPAASLPAVSAPGGALPPAVPEAAPVAAAPCPLTQQLVAIGITRSVAETLIAARPAAVEQQLQYWPHRAAIQNPGAALRRAIEEDWAAPEGWKQAQAKRRAARGSARPQPALEQERAEADGAEVAFDRWWAALPAAERERLSAEARAELIGNNPTLVQYYHRNPDTLPKALRPLLMRRRESDPAAGAP
jgi:hypothetical protein